MSPRVLILHHIQPCQSCHPFMYVCVLYNNHVSMSFFSLSLCSYIASPLSQLFPLLWFRLSLNVSQKYPTMTMIFLVLHSNKIIHLYYYHYFRTIYPTRKYILLMWCLPTIYTTRGSRWLSARRIQIYYLDVPVIPFRSELLWYTTT